MLVIFKVQGEAAVIVKVPWGEVYCNCWIKNTIGHVQNLNISHILLVQQNLH